MAWIQSPPSRSSSAIAPPERLRIFLKTLEGKLALSSRKNSTPLAVRNRLVSVAIPTIQETLSPLSLVEIRRLRPDLAPKQAQKTPNRRPQPPAKSPASRTTPKAPTTTGVGGPKVRGQLGGDALTGGSEGWQIAWSLGQRRVLREAGSGKSLFFTGPAGTGKSLLLRKIIARLPPDSTAVTAATGQSHSGPEQQLPLFPHKW